MTARSPRDGLIALLIIVVAAGTLAVIWKRDRDAEAANTPPTPTRTFSPTGPDTFPDHRPDYAAKLLAHLKSGPHGGSVEAAEVTETPRFGEYQVTVTLNVDTDVDHNGARSTANTVGILTDTYANADTSVTVQLIVVTDTAGRILGVGRGVATAAPPA
ncbi:hypothetical protein OG216_47710 (plasmid) [Streptomycetaceae bacterium NBC_01309]